MNLSGLFQYGTKNTDGRTTVNAKGSVSGQASTGNASQTVKGLAQGQSIQGEVVSKNGNEVQIRMDKDVVITARLDRDIPVSVGQNMTFEVKSNSGAQIALRPLFENLAMDPNALKALEAARLPASNELMRMVAAMMRQGMSIDRNALMDMGRAVMANPGANPETIVMMKALNLPITPENIQQFENYQNYKHQLLANVNDILAEIPKAFQSMVNGGKGDMALDFYTRLLNLFAGQTQEGEAGGGTAGRVFADLAGAEGETALPGQAGAGGAESAAGDGKEGGVLLQTDAKAENAGSLMEGAEGNAKATAGQQAGAIRNELQAGMGKELMGIFEDTGENKEDPATSAVRRMENGNGNVGQALQDEFLAGALDAKGRLQLASMLGKLGLPEETLAQVKEGSIDLERLMKEIQQAVSGQGTKSNHPELMKLFSSREYHQVLTKAIEQQWLMKPEQVAEKKEVESFYRKLRAQTAQLMESLGQAGKDTPLAKNLSTAQNNIDFMNQMNQMFQYIQLPLKMGGGEAHGDLYVYANRKNARKEDDSVSALLHLDMEHLGPMDIYVRMKDMDVSTKFYLSNEKILDFIAANIHLLEERLRKRGYSFQSEMQMTKEEKGGASVIETLTAQEKKATLLAQYSFDVRA